MELEFDTENKNNSESESKNNIDIEELCENGGLSCNFSVNSSNQANLINTYNASHCQVNSVFIVIPPYFVDNLDLEGLNLNIKIDGDGNFAVNDKLYSAIEVKPGIKIFGISKSE